MKKIPRTAAQKAPTTPLSDRPSLLLKDKKYWEKFDAEMAQRSEELAAARKDAILHLRVNSRDLARLKEKAARAGMKYQSFIAALLREAAQ